jgi:hypothetical protein
MAEQHSRRGGSDHASENAAGVWATYGWDRNPYLIGVYASEVEALRAAVENCGQVTFLPWGTTLTEAATAAAAPSGSSEGGVAS